MMAFPHYDVPHGKGSAHLPEGIRTALFTPDSRFARRQLRKGQWIYQPGEPAKEVYFIEEGRVKELAYSAAGKELIKKLYGKQEIFGVGAVLQDRRRHNFASAASAVTVCAIPLPAIQRVMRRHAEVNLYFIGLFSRTLIELENRLEAIVFRSSRSRILDFLIDLVQQRGERVGYEWVVRRFMPHQDIANLTATSRQTVNAVLNQLRRQEVIAFNRRRLLVRDLDRLRQIAGKERAAT